MSETEFGEASESKAEATKPKPAPRQFAPTVFRKLKPFEQLTKRQQETMSAKQAAEYKAEVKHQQDWGHLPPQVHELLRGVDPVQLSSSAVELLAKVRGTDPCHFAAAKAFHKWPMHAEMSLEAYDEAIERVLSERHGY